MGKLEGLEVTAPPIFWGGNPPANLYMVSVGYGYGKDAVSDVAGLLWQESKHKGQESDHADAKFVQLIGL